MIRSSLPLLGAVLMLAACERQGVNPPTEPAPPIQSSEVAPPVPSPPGVGPAMPGAGPTSFVGRWAGSPGWCANTQGAEQAINITSMRFEGYEHSCAITGLDQVVDGYEVSLACQTPGATSGERVRLSVQDDVLRLTWLNRNDAVVLLTRCPAAPEPTG